MGFGGGSSYLAILSLFLTNFYEIRTAALILNICVVSIGTVAYIRHGVFSFTMILKLIIGVVLGGGLGAYLSSNKFDLRIIGILTAVLVVYVGVRLVLLHGFEVRI